MTSPAGAPRDRGQSRAGAGLQVQLIDSFGCRRGAADVALPLSGQRLVALLGLSRTPVPRTSVAELLWPGHQPERAGGSLRTVVWRVGAKCPGLVATGPGTLVLGPDVDVDVDRIRDGIGTWYASGRPEPYEVADRLDLLASLVELLPGWYDDWVLLHRESLLALRVSFLADAADALLRCGEHGRALDLALAALSADPYDEQLHAQVAAIHLDQGNAAEALRQYEMCATLFRSELGMEPSKAFRRMLPGSTARDVPPALTGNGARPPLPADGARGPGVARVPRQARRAPLEGLRPGR